MRKIIALILVAVMALSLAACAGNGANGDETSAVETRIVTIRTQGSLYDENGKVELKNDGFKAVFKEGSHYLVVIFNEHHAIEVYEVREYDSKEEAKEKFDEVKLTFEADDEFITIGKSDNYIIYTYNPLWEEVREFYMMDMGRVIQKVGADNLISNQ